MEQLPRDNTQSMPSMFSVLALFVGLCVMIVDLKKKITQLNAEIASLKLEVH